MGAARTVAIVTGGVLAGAAAAMFLEYVGISELKPPIARALLVPIWPTDDSVMAELAPWQYGPGKGDQYWTSPLGVINGILPRFGLALVAHGDMVDGHPNLTAPYLSFTRPWWD